MSVVSVVAAAAIEPSGGEKKSNLSCFFPSSSSSSLLFCFLLNGYGATSHVRIEWPADRHSCAVVLLF